LYIAATTMLAWSLIATIAYFWARERGFPDLLLVHRPQVSLGRSLAVKQAAASLVKVYCAGAHNIVYTRLARFPLETKTVQRPARMLRLAVLGLGMTLFGVCTAEHLLRRAGYQGEALVRAGLLGPFLNVPYRLFLSAAVMHAASSLVTALQPTTIL
jgi:hypothetical protein